MGNTETRPEDKLPTNTGKFVWPEHRIEPQCQVQDEKELQALKLLPAVKPVNPEVLTANFMTRAHAVAPIAMDVRPIMLIIWDYNEHIKEHCEKAAAAQEHTLKQLPDSERSLAECLATMRTHANTINALTSSFGELQSVSAIVRDTTLRASYAEEAAERLERALAHVEGEIEVKFPNLLDSMPNIPSPPPEDSLFDMRSPERLAMPLGMM